MYNSYKYNSVKYNSKLAVKTAAIKSHPTKKIKRKLYRLNYAKLYINIVGIKKHYVSLNLKSIGKKSGITKHCNNINGIKKNNSILSNLKCNAIVYNCKYKSIDINKYATKKEVLKKHINLTSKKFVDKKYDVSNAKYTRNLNKDYIVNRNISSKNSLNFYAKRNVIKNIDKNYDSVGYKLNNNSLEKNIRVKKDMKKYLYLALMDVE